MTQFIFHSSRCLMLTKDWPQPIDHPCEQSSTHDCVMCKAYDQAEQDAIDTAVEVDRLEDKELIVAKIYATMYADWQPAEDTPYEVDVEMEIGYDKCKSAVCELNEYCWFEAFQHYKNHPEEYKRAKKAGKKMQPMIDDSGNEITKCNTRQVARIKKKSEEHPNWGKIVKIGKPESGGDKVPRSTYPGCWEEGRMVGYAEAMVEFKKRFQSRIEACNKLIESNPTGWPTVDLIARSIRAEFESQLKQI